MDATIGLAGSRAPCGTYHCGSSDWCTWTDIAAQLLAAHGRSDLLEPVEFSSRAHTAARPRNCAMSCEKLTSVGIAVRTWSQAPADYLSAEERSC